MSKEEKSNFILCERCKGIPSIAFNLKRVRIICKCFKSKNESLFLEIQKYIDFISNEADPTCCFCSRSKANYICPLCSKWICSICKGRDKCDKSYNMYCKTCNCYFNNNKTQIHSSHKSINFGDNAGEKSVFGIKKYICQIESSLNQMEKEFQVLKEEFQKEEKKFLQTKMINNYLITLFKALINTYNNNRANYMAYSNLVNCFETAKKGDLKYYAFHPGKLIREDEKEIEFLKESQLENSEKKKLQTQRSFNQTITTRSNSAYKLGTKSISINKNSLHEHSHSPQKFPFKCIKIIGNITVGNHREVTCACKINKLHLAIGYQEGTVNIYSIENINPPLCNLLLTDAISCITRIQDDYLCVGVRKGNITIFKQSNDNDDELYIKITERSFHTKSILKIIVLKNHNLASIATDELCIVYNGQKNYEKLKKINLKWKPNSICQLKNEDVWISGIDKIIVYDSFFEKEKFIYKDIGCNSPFDMIEGPNNTILVCHKKTIQIFDINNPSNKKILVTYSEGIPKGIQIYDNKNILYFQAGKLNLLSLELNQVLEVKTINDKIINSFIAIDQKRYISCSISDIRYWELDF